MPKDKIIPKDKNVKIRPIIAIACDEVRKEDNGKPFLVGLYTGGMTLGGVVPPDADDVCNLSIYLWIPFEITEIGVASFEVKLVMPNPKNQLRIRGKLSIDNIPQPTEITPLVLGPFPLKLWQSGNLEILFKHEDEAEYQTIRTIPITFNPIETSSSNGIEQLS